MSMLGRRKSKDQLSKSGAYIRNLEESGRQLPPTMRRGTREYIKCSYWQTMKQRTSGNKEFVDSSRNRSYKENGVSLEISKEDFHKWVDDNWSEFERLYSEEKIPSIDRIDVTAGYSYDNMKVIDLRENMAKDRRIPVVATPVLGGEEIRFACAKDAVAFGFCNKAIGAAIKRNGTHNGYSWRRI